MKRKPTQFTVRALSEHLRRSRASTLKLIAQAGITLQPVALHYSDDRPRTRRNYQPLTAQEADRVIKLVRARAGERVARAAKKPATSGE